MKCQICGRSDNGCYVTPNEFFCMTEEMEMMEILAQDPSAFDYLPDVSPGTRMAAFKIDEGNVISIDRAVEEHNLIRESVTNAFDSLGSQHPVEYQKFNGVWVIQSGRLFLYYHPNRKEWKLVDPLRGNAFEGTTWSESSQDLSILVESYLSANY